MKNVINVYIFLKYLVVMFRFQPMHDVNLINLNIGHRGPRLYESGQSDCLLRSLLINVSVRLVQLGESDQKQRVCSGSYF